MCIYVGEFKKAIEPRIKVIKFTKFGQCHTNSMSCL